MRIVAGRWRGRRIDAPPGLDTRPTSDRVREALFGSLHAALGSDLEDAVVLDAFAGSGALGLEALSRGAQRAVFVESDARAARVLNSNVAALDAGSESTVVVADAFRLAARGSLPGGPFSLLLLDPPYRIDAASIGDMLSALAKAGLVRHGALIVYEHGARTSPVWPEGFAPVRTRRYGSTAVSTADYEGGASLT